MVKSGELLFPAMHQNMSLYRLIFASLLFLSGPTLSVEAAEKRVPSSPAQIKLSFAPLVKKTAPAVVNIFTQKTVQARRGVPSLFDDPFFRQFFSEGFGVPRDRPKARQQNSLGSGVIVDPNGMIVTNQHVIQGANEIQVILADRREFVARVLVSDPKTDLAVLKITPEGQNLPYIQIQDSDDLEVGDLVLAIGNPFGVGQTVTSGIVSALARTKIGDSNLNSYIQTDAAINPGNSGGALVSVNGYLVGVNTAIYSKSGGSHGIGFAVPSNMVRAVIRGVSPGGGLVWPWFGATGQSVSQDIANSLGLERPTGVLITAVHKAGAAAKVGIAVGDVVLAVNGHEVNDTIGLRHRIATLPIGDSAVVRLWRGGKTRAVRLALMAAPDKPRKNETKMDGSQPLSGAIVGNMSPALAERTGIDPFVTGVFIFNIIRGSPANRLGFRAGDYLRLVNNRPVPSVKDLIREMEKPADRWRIAVLRNGRTRELIINR